MRSIQHLSKRELLLLNVFIHASAWTLLFLLPIAFFNVSFNRASIAFNILIFIKALLIFYLNFLFLVPKLLLRKKVGVFFISIFALLLLNLFITRYEGKYMVPFERDELPFEKPTRRELPSRTNGMESEILMLHENRIDIGKPLFDFRMIGQITFVLMLVGVSASLRLTEEWFKSEKRKDEVKNEQLTTELAFLKSQINPHFLFNSLNSIYSLAYKKSDRAPEAIIQLSKIMRYIIDDSASTAVLLEKELDHLYDYIELQKLRLTEKTKLSFTVHYRSQSELIEPMLLVPFVENAFKHGVDSLNNSFIVISIEVSKNLLEFKSTNTIARQKMETIEAESGIGLKNVIRRLDLLYPNAYKLKIIEEPEVYAVVLNLKLKSHEVLNS